MSIQAVGTLDYVLQQAGTAAPTLIASLMRTIGIGLPAGNSTSQMTSQASQSQAPTADASVPQGLEGQGLGFLLRQLLALKRS